MKTNSIALIASLLVAAALTVVITTMRPASAQIVDEIFLSPGIDIQPFVDNAPEG